MSDHEEVEDEGVGDVKRVTKRKSKAKLRRQKELDELHYLLQNAGLRAFLWRVLEECRLFHVIETHERETFRELGRRDVGLWTMAEIFEADPRAYTLMRQENEAAVKEQN